MADTETNKNLPPGIFSALRGMRRYERIHFAFLKALADFDLLLEIGYHQERGEPVTLKQLFLLDTASVATVQRRLRRLRRLGVVQQRRSARDRRAFELTLAPKVLRLFEGYRGWLRVADG